MYPEKMLTYHIIKFDLIDLRSKKLPEAIDELSADSVHIWLAHLDIAAVQIRDLSNILSKDEWDRAKRFVFEQHRTRFIAARGFLRLILSRYLEHNPELIRFRYNPFGKPMLDIVSEEKTLQFNLSHANGIALYALSKGSVGIDIEFLQRQLAFEQLSEQFFAPNEAQVLRGLPEAEQRISFFQLWTRKEAYIKAIGKGLSLPLDQFDVSQSPDNPVLHLNATNAEFGLSPWYVKNFIPQQGYMAAIALEGNCHKISYFQAQNCHLV